MPIAGDAVQRVGTTRGPGKGGMKMREGPSLPENPAETGSRSQRTGAANKRGKASNRRKNSRGPSLQVGVMKDRAQLQSRKALRKKGAAAGEGWRREDARKEKREQAMDEKVGGGHANATTYNVWKTRGNERWNISEVLVPGRFKDITAGIRSGKWGRRKWEAPRQARQSLEG